MEHIIMNTPIGALQITEEDGYITAVTHITNFAVQETDTENAVLLKARQQLTDYFMGGLKEFDLPIKINVTPYRQKVLEQLMKVPFGQTTTYRELAEKTGNPKAARAVGSAMRTNPLVIIVPCHRVLPANGKIGNYSAGGPANKDWLLCFEKQNR